MLNLNKFFLLSLLLRQWIIIGIIFFYCYDITNAAIPVEGWYSGLMLTGSQATDLEFNTINPVNKQPVTGQINYKAVLGGGGGQIGYRYSKTRFEIELLYDTNSFRQVTIGNISLQPNENSFALYGRGNTNFFASLFDVYVEIYKDNYEISLIPYIGLGIGYASINNIFQLSRYQTTLYIKKNSASTVIGQAIIGLTYFMSDSFSAALDFRYLNTPRHVRLDSSMGIATVNCILNLSFT